MARVSVGGGASIQGVTHPPRPTAQTEGALYDAEVKRARVIALTLFGLLVIVHAQKSGD